MWWLVRLMSEFQSKFSVPTNKKTTRFSTSTSKSLCNYIVSEVELSLGESLVDSQESYNSNDFVPSNLKELNTNKYETEQISMKIPNLAVTCNRIGVSDGTASLISTTLIKDFGI